jgi:hypothetical protein
MDRQAWQLQTEREDLTARYHDAEREHDHHAMDRIEERLWEIEEALELVDLERRAGVEEAVA